MLIFLFILVPAFVLAAMLYIYNKQESNWQKEVAQYQATTLPENPSAASQVVPDESAEEQKSNEITETLTPTENENHTSENLSQSTSDTIYDNILPQPQSVGGFAFRQPEKSAPQSNRVLPQPYQVMARQSVAQAEMTRSEPEYFQYFKHKETQEQSVEINTPSNEHTPELTETQPENDVIDDGALPIAAESQDFQTTWHKDSAQVVEIESETEIVPVVEPSDVLEPKQPELERKLAFELVEPPRAEDVITFEETVRNLRQPLHKPQLETVKLNTASKLSIKNKRPAPNLEIITLETALRDWQNVENSLANMPEPVKPQTELALLETFSSVRERTLQRDDLLTNKYGVPTDAETIGIDDIRDSLTRQRRARRHQTIAELPVHIHSTILHVIPEEEVIANLARVDEPMSRRVKNKRKTPLDEASLTTVQVTPAKKSDEDLYRVPPPKDMMERFARQRQQLSLARPVALAEPIVVPDMDYGAPNILTQPVDFYQSDYANTLSGSLNDFFNTDDELLDETADGAWQDLSNLQYLSNGYVLPSTQLLLPPQFNQDAVQSAEQLLENGILIEEKLAEFKVKVKVVDAISGPVITRYEIEPDTGVRGNSVLNLEKDLARLLGKPSIRVVETIPDKNCMGIELPNPRRQIIRISEIFNSPAFTESRSKLTLALGQDITGQPVVTDLAKAPHLLVAGTTGSGKSVGVNSMILSLLFKATPDDVRLIMIDPKMLELSVYEGIPHLLAPVITDMKYAANALNWCVGEMDKRYRLMAHLGVRNLTGYNMKIVDAQMRGEKYTNPFSLNPDEPEPLEKLPFIVVVVDEFADLMMVAGKQVEQLIARLAQKARAAGIHLILATQRPSVDVITGLIKANIPTRIAFQVSSKIDSRTILDQMGAENLLGQGDMLFLPPGTGYPQRVHGAFVADSEVHQVVEYLKQFGEPNYIDAIITPENEELGFSGSHGGQGDDLYEQAIETVLRTQKTSISALQRNLRIGYNKAAILIEQMEVDGILSAADHAGKRTILARNHQHNN